MQKLKLIIARLHASLSRRPRLGYLTVALISLIFLGWLQSGPGLGDPDGFYHIKIAQLMRQQVGFITEFPWLPLTVLMDSFADQAWLYHVLIIPFTYLANPLIGLKIATVLLGTAMLITFYWVLKKLSVKYSGLYVAVLFLTTPFIFRLSLAKASALYILVFVLGLYFIIKHKPWALALLSIGYVWLHGSWPLLFMASGLYWVITGISNSLKHQGVKLKLLINNFFSGPQNRLLMACLLGSLMGLIINPYFPKNLEFFWYQNVLIGLSNLKSIISIGAEWYPFANNGIVSALLLLSVISLLASLIFALNLKTQDKRNWFLGVLSLFFLGLTLRSSRHIEFFAPTMLLFTSLSLAQLTQYHGQRFKSLLSNLGQRQKTIIKLLSLLLVLVMTVNIVQNTIKTRWQLWYYFPLDKYQAASLWLKKQLEPGEVVSHTRYSDFPVLFYYNHELRFISGLDPALLYLNAPSEHTFWRRMVEASHIPSLQEAAQTLKSTTIMVEKDFTNLWQGLTAHPEWHLVYEDSEVWIFR